MHDHLGSNNLALLVDGGVTEQLVNYPYGHPRKEIRTPSQPCASDYKFTGKERDDESGLQYFEARYLIGHVGCFASVDPLYAEVERPDKNDSTLRSSNPYAYGLHNPLRFYDPDGLNEASIIEDRVGLSPTIDAQGNGVTAYTSTLSEVQIEAQAGVKASKAGVTVAGGVKFDKKGFSFYWDIRVSPSALFQGLPGTSPVKPEAKMCIKFGNKTRQSSSPSLVIHSAVFHISMKIGDSGELSSIGFGTPKSSLSLKKYVIEPTVRSWENTLLPEGARTLQVLNDWMSYAVWKNISVFPY